MRNLLRQCEHLYEKFAYYIGQIIKRKEKQQTKHLTGLSIDSSISVKCMIDFVGIIIKKYLVRKNYVVIWGFLEKQLLVESKKEQGGRHGPEMVRFVALLRCGSAKA